MLLQMALFHSFLWIRANDFKLCMETQKALHNQNSLEKEEQSRDVRLYGKATVIKTEW